jgi:hypothetical protein
MRDALPDAPNCTAATLLPVRSTEGKTCAAGVVLSDSVRDPPFASIR